LDWPDPRSLDAAVAHTAERHHRHHSQSQNCRGVGPTEANQVKGHGTFFQCQWSTLLAKIGDSSVTALNRIFAIIDAIRV
jgi:hypothetical protein